MIFGPEHHLARAPAGRGAQAVRGPSPAPGAGVALLAPKVRLAVYLESGTWKDYGIGRTRRRPGPDSTGIADRPYRHARLADPRRSPPRGNGPQDAPESTNGTGPGLLAIQKRQRRINKSLTLQTAEHCGANGRRRKNWARRRSQRGRLRTRCPWPAEARAVRGGGRGRLPLTTARPGSWRR